MKDAGDCWICERRRCGEVRYGAVRCGEVTPRSHLSVQSGRVTVAYKEYARDGARISKSVSRFRLRDI